MRDLYLITNRYQRTIDISFEWSRINFDIYNTKEKTNNYKIIKPIQRLFEHIDICVYANRRKKNDMI